MAGCGRGRHDHPGRPRRGGQAVRRRTRPAVIRGVLAAAGDLPVCVGVSHAATDRAIAFAREAEALGAHSVMLAPPAARPPERRRRARATTWPSPAAVDAAGRRPGPPGQQRRVRCPSSLLAAIADRAPTCRVIKLEDEPSPPKVGRLAGAPTGPARARRPRRDHAARGAAPRRRRHDDRLRLPGGPGRHRRSLSGRRRGRAPARSFHRVLPLIRFENQPGINLAIRKHLYQRRGAIATARLRAPGAALDAGTIADLDLVLDERRPGGAARPGLGQRADHPAVDRDDRPGDVGRRRRQQERADAAELERVAVASERDRARSCGAGSPRPARPRRVPGAASSWAIRSVSKPARREAVDPDRDDLLDQRLDQAGQPGPDQVRGRQARDRLARRARQDDQDRRVAALAQVRQGGAQEADRRSTACRRWRSARPPRRGPRTGRAAVRRS